MNQSQRYCPTCDRKTLHVKGRKPLGCFANVFMCVITLGLWVPIAVLSVGLGNLTNQLEPHRCQACGKINGKREKPTTASKAKTAKPAPGFSWGRSVEVSRQKKATGRRGVNE